MKQGFDWQKVVALEPKGYVELTDGESRVLHGPIDIISITGDDIVRIELKWMARMLILPGGISNGEWEAHQNKTICFPNFAVSFIVENTPDKGKRVRFGMNVLYLTEVGFGPEQVKGLTVPV